MGAGIAWGFGMLGLDSSGHLVGRYLRVTEARILCCTGFDFDNLRKQDTEAVRPAIHPERIQCFVFETKPKVHNCLCLT